MAKKKQQQQQIGSMMLKRADSGLIYLKGTIKGEEYVAYKATTEYLAEHPKAPNYSGYKDLDYEKGEKKEYCIALWGRTSEKGNKYLSGIVDGLNVVGFYDDATMTFRIYESRPVQKTTKKPVDDTLPF